VSATTAREPPAGAIPPGDEGAHFVVDLLYAWLDPRIRLG
jgi:hypothetical protein